MYSGWKEGIKTIPFKGLKETKIEIQMLSEMIKCIVFDRWVYISFHALESFISNNNLFQVNTIGFIPALSRKIEINTSNRIWRPIIYETEEGDGPAISCFPFEEIRGFFKAPAELIPKGRLPPAPVPVFTRPI